MCPAPFDTFQTQSVLGCVLSCSDFSVVFDSVVRMALYTEILARSGSDTDQPWTLMTFLGPFEGSQELYQCLEGSLEGSLDLI